MRIQGGACRDSPLLVLGLLRDRTRISEAGARGGRTGPGSGTVGGKKTLCHRRGEAQTVSSPFYFHILLPPVWVDGGVLVWLGLFCGCIGGLDEVPVSVAGRSAVYWIGPRFVNISFSAYRPRAQKWPPSPNTHHPSPLSLVCPRTQASYLSENSSFTCLQLSGNRQGSTVLSLISILCQLIWGHIRIPVFCSRGLFRFSIARQMRPLPRYTLPITPPKTFTGVSSTVSICPILDKTKHIQAKYRNSLKIAPAQICFAPYPRYPQNVLGRFRKSKNECYFEKIQN